MRMLLRGAAALATLVTVASLTGGAAAVPRPGTSAPVAQAARIPDGVTAGVAVFDRRTGTFTEQVDESARFRSASVVKLLLALDFLWDRGPAYTIPEADRALLEPMLRSSDADAADHYWGEAGLVRGVREGDVRHLGNGGRGGNGSRSRHQGRRSRDQGRRGRRGPHPPGTAHHRHGGRRRPHARSWPC
ncbi:hypothetical protein ACIGPN_35720 [Streptomyces afghaniensis]|uniref:hypothetical protein n=1 Tax=Streptomyces afghaniensis TaxID=66865 RepID=UPI0037CFDA89